MNEDLRRIRMAAVLVWSRHQSDICVESLMTVGTDCPWTFCKSSKHTQILALTFKQMDPFCELNFTPFCWQHPYKYVLYTPDLEFALRLLWKWPYFCIWTPVIWYKCRSQWPCGLRRRCSAARLLRSWARIPPEAWMFVCCECCVLSGRGLCDVMITRPEESYRQWRVAVCDQETSKTRRLKPATELWKIQPDGL
jgi:hypothetical protein